MIGTRITSSWCLAIPRKNNWPPIKHTHTRCKRKKWRRATHIGRYLDWELKRRQEEKKKNRAQRDFLLAKGDCTKLLDFPPAQPRPAPLRHNLSGSPSLSLARARVLSASSSFVFLHDNKRPHYTGFFSKTLGRIPPVTSGQPSATGTLLTGDRQSQGPWRPPAVRRRWFRVT